MPRYIVNPGYQINVGGTYLSHPTEFESDDRKMEYLKRKRYVTQLDQTSPMPIADYKEMTAKEVIKRLADLNKGELDAVKQHEEAQSRPRKSIIKEAKRLLEQ